MLSAPPNFDPLPRRHKPPPVYLDADGRQFVLDDDGQPVYGVWVYIDEPHVVETFKHDKTES